MFAFRSQPGLEDENLICVCLIININPFLKVFLLGQKKKICEIDYIRREENYFLEQKECLSIVS